MFLAYVTSAAPVGKAIGIRTHKAIVSSLTLQSLHYPLLHLRPLISDIPLPTSFVPLCRQDHTYTLRQYTYYDPSHRSLSRPTRIPHRIAASSILYCYRTSCQRVHPSNPLSQ